MSPLNFSLSFIHICPCLVGSWKRCQGGVCMQVVRVLSRVDFRSPRAARLHWLLNDHLANSKEPTPTPWGSTVPVGTSQTSGGRWLMLGYFPSWKGWHSVLPGITVLGMDLLFLPALFLPKLRVTFRMPRYVMVLHTTVLLSRQLISRKWNVARVRGMPVLTIFPIVVKQLNWYNRGMSFWRLTAPVVAVLCGAGVTFSAMWSSL